MSYGGIISQGKYTQAATAVPQFITVPSGVDRFEVVNFSGSDGAVSGDGCTYIWQRGMATDTGLIYYHPAADQTLAVDAMASGGFIVVDSSSAVLGSSIAATGLSNATSMTLLTASTAGIIAGQTVIRLLKESGDTITNAETVLNKDFLVVTVNAGVSLVLAPLATAPGLTTGTLHFKVVYIGTEFYPKARYIANINTTTKVVTTTVPHGLTVGQQIRFNIPRCSGTVQLNPTTDNQYLSATVVAVNANLYQFTVDTDMSGMTAFTYPTHTNFVAGTAQFPRIIPIGENTAEAISTLNPISQDATVNQSQLGIILGLGVAGDGTNGPAGAANDVIYWSAWKAANVTNS